mmetsp:Transcript_18672/g.58716  ORF Transcript_18672/g.58716 Transcript_18672/m.58716 type:complete len:103 (-) Transcript_18672:34-342(-)
MMFFTFFARTDPAHSIANPACIVNTSTPHTKTHIALAAAATAATSLWTSSTLTDDDILESTTERRLACLLLWGRPPRFFFSLGLNQAAAFLWALFAQFCQLY